MWELISGLIGPMPGISIPERMFMIALAGTGFLMVLKAVVKMIDNTRV